MTLRFKDFTVSFRVDQLPIVSFTPACRYFRPYRRVSVFRNPDGWRLVIDKRDDEPYEPARSSTAIPGTFVEDTAAGYFVWADYAP